MGMSYVDFLALGDSKSEMIWFSESDKIIVKTIIPEGSTANQRLVMFYLSLNNEKYLFDKDYFNKVGHPVRYQIVERQTGKVRIDSSTMTTTEQFGLFIKQEIADAVKIYDQILNKMKENI